MNRTKRLLLALVALMLALSVLAACGSDDDDKPAASPATGGGTTVAGGAKEFSGSVTIAVNPWDGSAANANVAKIILEKQGVKVTLRDIDENAVWPALDSGTIGANLEVWPSGHAQDIKTYIDDKKSVIDAGLLGPTGHIGWYIPKFVADAHPEYTSWEGLKSEDAAKYFATAETGDQGQFLLGDPSYVSYDADIIKNLDLPFKVVTGGGEAALITAIGTAFQDEKPILIYFYKPQWANSKYDLVSVKLPDITPECEESAAGQGKDGKYACDYPTDELKKTVSAKLQSDNPAVFGFFEKMSWTDEDQNTVTTYKNEDGMSIEESAQKWVDDNEAKWQAWLS